MQKDDKNKEIVILDGRRSGKTADHIKALRLARPDISAKYPTDAGLEAAIQAETVNMIKSMTQKVLFVGENGAGKQTAINAIYKESEELPIPPNLAEPFIVGLGECEPIPALAIGAGECHPDPAEPVHMFTTTAEILAHIRTNYADQIRVGATNEELLEEIQGFIKPVKRTDDTFGKLPPADDLQKYVKVPHNIFGSPKPKKPLSRRLSHRRNKGKKSRISLSKKRNK